MIQAVLFDCDGLMFETERISITMWKSYARRYGVKLPHDFFMRITGTGKQEAAAYMQSIPHVEKILPIVSKKRFDLDFWNACGKDTLNKKGLISLFAYLQEQGYRVGICSSSPRVYVETLLNRVSVPLHYDAIICGDMVSKAKPDPEIFLKGAQELGVKPEACLVLEDSKMGILAAQRAGMHRCWIPDMIEADEEMKQALEYECQDLTEVIDLLKNWNRE